MLLTVPVREAVLQEDAEAEALGDIEWLPDTVKVAVTDADALPVTEAVREPDTEGQEEPEIDTLGEGVRVLDTVLHTVGEVVAEGEEEPETDCVPLMVPEELELPLPLALAL